MAFMVLNNAMIFQFYCEIADIFRQQSNFGGVFLQIAEMLLEQGAYYDIRDNEGNTPIFMASTNGHNSCIRVLIEVRR